MEHHDRSNLTKLLFADDESVVSSTICEGPADQNQIRSQDELTNPNPKKAMDTSENDNVSIVGSENVVEKRSIVRKRHINSVCMRHFSATSSLPTIYTLSFSLVSIVLVGLGFVNSSRLCI